jgi:transcriptional regulator with XRE-family HTH domain
VALLVSNVTFDILRRRLPVVQELVGPIARNLRRLREEQNLSISAVADRASLSKSTLSKLERGNGNPSIDTLWSLARVLGVPFAALFEENGHPDVQVLRYEEAQVVTRPVRGAGVAKTVPGVDMRHLGSFHGRGEVEVYVVDLQPGTRHSSAAHSPGVVEHVILTSGSADVGPDGEATAMRAGDRLTFRADRPHHYETAGEPARLVAILDYP